MKLSSGLNCLEFNSSLNITYCVFVPRTPKSKKNQRTPKVSMGTIGRPLNPCKRGFVIFTYPLEPIHGPPVKNLSTRVIAYSLIQFVRISFYFPKQVLITLLLFFGSVQTPLTNDQANNHVTYLLINTPLRK